MRRFVLLAALIALVIWRNRTLDRYDREHGFGPYAPVTPAPSR
ncbi:MAG: hypothetical protein U5K30_00745 [Acidimicrobiales bacterium]|nr:hypothetical protein [Acidimicrobiales bacterium]